MTEPLVASSVVVAWRSSDGFRAVTCLRFSWNYHLSFFFYSHVIFLLVIFSSSLGIRAIVGLDVQVSPPQHHGRRYVSLVTNYCNVDPPAPHRNSNISNKLKLFFSRACPSLIGGGVGGAVRLPALLHGDKASTYPVHTLIWQTRLFSEPLMHWG